MGTVKVQVVRDRSGDILDVRSAAELERRPWAAGDRATFEVKAEDWDKAEYDEHRAPNVVEAKALVDATKAELVAEAKKRGLDLQPILDKLLPDGGL